MNNPQKLHEVCSKFVQFFNYSGDDCQYTFQFEYNMVNSTLKSLYLIDNNLRNIKYENIFPEIEKLKHIMPIESAFYYYLDKYWKQFFKLRNILLKDLESGVYDDDK